MGEFVEYGDISPRTNFRAWGKLLKRTAPGIITERTAQTKPMTKNSGKTLKFRRYIALDPVIAPLTEGVPPTASKPTYVDVECSIEQYGDWIGITDVIQDTHEDPVMQEFRSLQARQMRESRESLNIGVLTGGTSVYYANGSTRGEVNTPVTAGTLKKLVRGLRRENAEYYMEVLSGSAKYGTTPVGPSFFGMCHTDCEADLQGLAKFTEVKDYPEPSKALEEEFGACERVRFSTSTMFDPWEDAGGANADMIATTDAAAAVDVYPVVITAPDAWATVPLRGAHSGHLTVVNPKPSHGNELGQRGSLGWKYWHTALILNDGLMSRIEMACTEDPS